MTVLCYRNDLHSAVGKHSKHNMIQAIINLPFACKQLFAYLMVQYQMLLIWNRVEEDKVCLQYIWDSPRQIFSCLPSQDFSFRICIGSAIEQWTCHQPPVILFCSHRFLDEADRSATADDRRFVLLHNVNVWVEALSSVFLCRHFPQQWHAQLSGS